MSIQEHLNKIRNAVYGREVRESIAKGIETAYDDASEKDNANMEVKLARGTNPNLNTRLNKMDETDRQTTEQLARTEQEVAKKPNENETRLKRDKIEPEDASEDLLALLTGQGTIELKSIPQDGSVTPKSTNDISGLNMYPFQRKAILSEDEAIALQISRAFKNVKLYGANEMLDYRIATIRKLQYNETRDLYESGVWVSDSNNNVVSLYSKVSESTDDVEIEGFKKIELSEWNQSGISGEILIDWSVLPVGFYATNLGFDETGLDIKTISNGLEQYMTTEDEEWVV